MRYSFWTIVLLTLASSLDSFSAILSVFPTDRNNAEENIKEAGDENKGDTTNISFVNGRTRENFCTNKEMLEVNCNVLNFTSFSRFYQRSCAYTLTNQHYFLSANRTFEDFNEINPEPSIFENNRARQSLSDEIFEKNAGNYVIGVALDLMIVPGFVKGEEDTKTKVDISDKHFVYGLFSEYFLSEKHRIGAEFHLHNLEKSISVRNNSSSPTISGGAGFILSLFTYVKIGIGPGIFSNKYRSKLSSQINSYNHDLIDIDREARFRMLKTKIYAEPKPYLLLGIGGINTTLVKVNGKMDHVNITDYNQKKLAIEFGGGLLSRPGRRLNYDMSFKYIWSSNYSPSIGGLYGYSGFRLQLNIGYMMGPQFHTIK